MKPHYFNQEKPDADDIFLQMAIGQGYVPKTCLLGGQVVMGETNAGRDACAGCEGPREKCHGRPKKDLFTLEILTKRLPTHHETEPGSTL